MRVSDIFRQCQEITGVGDEATNFDKISDAVECLSNKGLVDAMQGYLEILIAQDRTITLPRDVEVPVKVNIGDNPAFSRTKLFEFTMNGPGSNYTPDNGWKFWEDRGMVPVITQPDSPTKVTIDSEAADNGKKVYIWGRLEDNTEVNETLTLNSNTLPVSEYLYASITKVIKDLTANSISLQASGETLELRPTLSIYAPDETEPQYRQIKVSQTGTTAHILFRRSVYRISSQNDWIPIQSRMGLFLMLRANKFYTLATPADIQTAQALEKQAAQFVEEEQKSRNLFAEVASQTEADSSYGLSINNRDSLIVADIYDDASQICGPIGQQKVFDRITDAVEMLDRKGQWDGNEGYVDISAFDSSYVTLPRYVDYVQAINIGNSPARFRNKWHEFHLNGPGSSCSQSCRSWTDLGDVVTLVDITEERNLIYKTDSSADNGKTITIYGYDENDKWIVGGITLNGDSNAVFPTHSSHTKVKRIDRIVRQATTGFASLIADNEDLIGYYYPDETEPNYKRIKLPDSTCWIRMRYKKRSLKITSLSDQLHLRSRMAILAALSSIQAMRAEKPDLQTAGVLEAKALQLLTEEKNHRDPHGSFSFSFDTATSMSSPEHAQF